MLNEAKRGSLTDDRDRSLKGRLKEIIPWKGDSLHEVLRKLIFIGAVAVLIYSAYTTYIYFFGSRSMIKDQQQFADLFNEGAQSAESTQSTASNGSSQSGDTETPSESDNPAHSPDVSKPTAPLKMLSNFEKLYPINNDVVGWLKIPGIYFEGTEDLAINYPVTQTDDNDYYLTHDFNGDEQEYGCLYADHKAEVLDPEKRSSNVTIYGHNMKTEFYFHHLRDYNRTNPGFVSDHRIIDFTTLYQEDRYIIFACFFVSTKAEDDDQPLFMYHNCVDFPDAASFDYWYKNVMYRNYYKTDIECDINDDYLTLSTCSFEITDARFVVVARKLRPGEDPDSYTYESNSDRHMPVKWYQAFGYDVPAKDDGPDYEYYVPSET